MRPFWSLFQPAEKLQTAVGEKHAAGATSPPQALPEPRSPIFQPYPPQAQEWAFTENADGQHLQSLWQNVKAGDGQPLASRAGFLAFATALTRALETPRTAAVTATVCGDGRGIGDEPDPGPAVQLAPSRPPQHEHDSEVSRCGPTVAVNPTVAGGACGIPTDVVRGLAQAVLSAAVCRCGREVATDSPVGLGCSAHGLAALSWTRVLPIGGLRGGSKDIRRDGGDTNEAWLGGGGGGGGDDSGGGGGGGGRGGSVGVGVGVGVGVSGGATSDGGGTASSTLGGRARKCTVNGTERRRACLVEALRALSMACRWPHTREELARQCRGGHGGIAKGLGLLCDTLCARVVELRRRRQGPFRRPIATAGAGTDRAWQDLLFFVHCLVPLARIVADSAPAAAAWYDLVNGNTLAGTGLPRHPWVGSATGGGTVPSCAASTAAIAADVARKLKAGDAAVDGEGLSTLANARKAETCDAHIPDAGKEEAKFTAMDSAANKDEWSAMLVSAGLVRSLVGALQTCLDACIAARGGIVGDVPKRKSKVEKNGKADLLSPPEPAESTAVVRPLGKEGTDGRGGDCLGCGLDSAQVIVTLALGALLSAHRLATRDRFQLAGGARRLHRVVSQPHSDRDVLHTCLPRREGCTGAGASAVGMPFLHEHCALVSMQVLRLCLRSSVSEVVPPDIIEGAAQMVGALSPLMLSAWGKRGGGGFLNRGRGFRPRSWGASNDDQEFQQSEKAGAANTSSNFTVPRPKTKRRPLSRTLLPLDCSEKVFVPANSRSAKESTFSAQQDSTSTIGCHPEVHHTLESPSYLLCGPRSDEPPSSSSFPDSADAGGVKGGIEMLARDRGPDAVAVASALDYRLAASLAVNDVLILAQSGCGLRCPQVSPGEVDESGPDGDDDTCTAYAEGVPSEALLPGCSLMVLMGFHDSILSIIGDCAAGVERCHGSAHPPREIGAGAAACVGGMAEIHSAVLRSALMSFVELVVGSHAVSCTQGPNSDVVAGDRGSPEQSAGKAIPLRPGGSLDSRQGKPSQLPAACEHAKAVAPVPQLVAIRFFLQAVHRWPRLAVKLMQEVGVWDIIFSERFLSGGTRLVARAIGSLGEDPVPGRMAAATAALGSDGPSTSGIGSSICDGAVGWGLLHDATLLLLEAVTVSRCLLRMEKVAAESSAQRHTRKQGKAKLRTIGDDDLGPDRPSEVRKYVSFLARDESTQPSPITAIQGCRWLRAVVATELTVGGGMLLPTTLRVAAVRLAFRFCDRGNGVGSKTRGLGGAAWPLVYTSLCLVRDLVDANGLHGEGLLFQAAAAIALDVDAASAMTAATVKSRTHRVAASMTSDVSTPTLHAANTDWAPESAGSRTPLSTDDTSPRVRRSFSFGDASLSPLKPRPLPEVLFKAALDPRARGAALCFAAKLGVEAGTEVMTSPDVDIWSPKGPNHQRGGRRSGGHDARQSSAMRETAVEVLSGLVEGYLCLCERAAAATLAGSAEADDGEGLLLDALNGACMLMRLGAASYEPVGTARARGVGDGPGFRAVGVPSRHARTRRSGVSPLLQETFREHWASARLLAVLESVVAGSLTLMSPAVTIANCVDVVSTSLALFTSMMAGNSLCKKAFQRAVIERYARNIAASAAVAPSSQPPGVAGAAKRIDGGSFAALADLAAAVPAERLSRALMEMLMDGEVPACVLEVTKAEPGFERDWADGAGDQKAEGAGEDVATREGGLSATAAAPPPEIRNPLVVPLIFELLPDWPVLEQERTMKAFCLLLRGTGGGMVNRSLCCDIKPALMDQLLDTLPRLDAGRSEGEDTLQGLAIDLVRHLGSHSINVAQLKKMFRLMQPLSSSQSSEHEGATGYANRRRRSGSGAKTPPKSLAAPLQPSWLCCLLRALRGMMDDEPGPRRFFLFDGLTSGLRLPEMPRWPAQKGYTFCAWVRLEARQTPSTGRTGNVGGGHNTARVARAPCLFSFCGEWGQGVAACFIPLRRGHGRQRGAAAPAGAADRATPQTYALELRVGTGRNRPPACVRFSGAVATAGEWVFVAVVHAASSWGQRGEASVLVDSCWRTSASPFPRFGDGGVTTASVACHCPSQMLEGRDRSSDREGAGTRIAGRPMLGSLRGQMGPIYLFAGSISEELLRGIRQLGPGYAYSFEPLQVDSREIALLPTPDPHLQALSELDTDVPEASSVNMGKTRTDSGPRRAETPAVAASVAARQDAHLAALSGALTPLIMLAYNPSVWGGEYFLDNTPECNPVRWASGSPASSSTRKQWEPDGASRARTIYSMAGSHAHVLVQPRYPSTHRGASGSGGSSSGAQAAQARSDDRNPWSHRPNATRRTRGWSGWSGCSEEDNVFGGEESESAPSLRPRPRPGYMHAMRLPGTRECVTRDVRDALDCLGGVKVLLPLFAQYDHGVLQDTGHVSYRTDPRLNETVLALLAGTLRDSLPNRRFLRRHGGLSLIPHCLERVSPQHMSPDALAQACRLADRLGSWSEEWADSAIESLLSPSRLWVFAPPEAQLTLVGVLRGMTRRCPGRMRRVVGFQRCLDALDLYYWYTPPSSDNVDGEPRSRASDGSRRSRAGHGVDGVGAVDSTGWSYASRQWVHPSTGEVLGLKASGAALREIRARLLDTAVIMVCDGDGISRSEVAAMLGFLRGCRDDSSRCEALRLILRLTDDHRQAGRFVVASGYVAAESYEGDDGEAGEAGGGSDDDVGGNDGAGRGPGRGGTAVALLLALLHGDDPTVRLLAFLAFGQVLIACLQIEDRSNASSAMPDKQGRSHQSATHGGTPRDVSATARQSASTSSDAATPTPASQSTASSSPPNTAVVEFMGRADAKAEALVVLTGTSSSREGRHPRSAERTRGRSDGSNGGGRDAEELLELRGGIWEHVGLPRRRITDVLLWAQRRVTKADSRGAVPSSNGGSPGGGWRPDVQRRQQGESSESKRRPDEGDAAERTVARVAMGVLQGLLIGELPRGFAASVVSSSGRREDSRDATTAPAREATVPIVPASRDQLLDPFFLETPMATAGASGTGGESASGWRHRGLGGGDSAGSRGGGAPQRSHSRSRPGRSGSAKSVNLPLRVRLPEAFPALCQQVATAPVGPAPRGDVVETLIAAVHNQRNSAAILSVDSWQQYLLSVVSSAQGRQAVATAADATDATAASSGGEHYSGADRPSAAGLAEDGGARRYERRSARDEATEEGWVMDRTVRLICWLSMWEAREGTPGRPGAGFATLQDTMSFLRCQGELGTMECVSIGESILRHMVGLLKREIDSLESEINGWARGSHLPPLRPLPGVSGGRHGTAAALACVWPLTSLVVEFIAIPPVANPPAASAANAPTPSAAALAVSTAVADNGGGPRSGWSDDSLTCPSPMQGILQWLDTGMKLPMHAHVPSSLFTPNGRPVLPSMGSSVLPTTANSAAGWRAWELLDAAVDLVGPTGDTLLWDARYRHGLSAETGFGGSSGEGVYASGAVDPSAVEVLDWGRPGSESPGRRDDTRTVGDRRTSGAAVRPSAPRFIDAKGKKGNPLADAGGVPWMLVRLLLAIFVSGGAADGNHDIGTWVQGNTRRPSSGRGGGSGSGGSGGSGKGTGGGKGNGSCSGGSGKGGGGAGSGPPSIALVALQRLIALMNSLESSGYKHFEFEVLHMVARISTALRTTRLTPLSAWVLGALQLLAKCLAAQASQIEDLLVAGEERLHDRQSAEHANKETPAPGTPGEKREPLPPRTRLVFSRGSKRPGWWFWDFLSGGGGDKANRRRIVRKGVLHQIAAETPSLAVVPSGDLALEIIRRTLGIELPGRPTAQERAKGGRGGTAGGGAAAASTVVAAPLTWDLLEASFEPVSEGGAGQEAMGLATRLNEVGMHRHMLQVLVRVRALETRGVEAGVRVPTDVHALGSEVLGMEARRVTTLGEAKERATSRRQAQWEAVLKQLATERGPWGRGVEAIDLDSVYWALSPSEDDRGRRLKLVRNPHGGAHTIASERTRGVTRPTAVSSRPSSRWGWRPPLKTRRESESVHFVDSARDASSSAADVGQAGEDSGMGEGQGSELPDEWRDVRAMSAQTSLWKDLCKYQRKSIKPAMVGESLDEGDETEEEEDEEELEDGSEFGESDYGNRDDDGDAGCDGPRRGGRPAAPVAYSSTADVVRPFCITPGLISLEDHRLVFARSQDSGLGCAEGTKDAKRGDQPLADNYRWALRQAPSCSWPTSGLRRVLFRPYGGMRFAALEMWFAGGGTDEDGCTEGTVLLGLPSDSLARGLHEALRRARPPALEPFLGRFPSTVMARSNAGTWGASASGGVGMLVGPSCGGRGGMLGSGAGVRAVAAAEAARTPLTQAWVRRRCGVTNFDYLRGLNAAAGRTTADLSRYPVFPWVLSERAWRAEELDLKDERNFRDLAWPMGAQRPEQREALHMRYADLESCYLEQQRMGGEMADLALPPFHHGSHYSSSAYVLWFLMRLEPFTSLHIHLQDGRFDKADRLFRSLPDAYASCTRNPGDVKEAIPELYFLPELLVNATGLDLGRPQSTGTPLSDVELPPWAHGDPWEFVRRHREALESEHVSLRLHAWIDLVFGCHQRPPALNRGRRGAVESCNVFFHLTYPGAVDLPRLREQDPQLYESTMKQIEEFGQAPAQLFRSPHPARQLFARAEVVRPIASPIPGANTAPLTEATPPVAAAQAESESARELDSTRLAQTVVSYPRKRVSRGAVLVVSDLHPWTERLVTVDARRAIGVHGWRVLPPEMSPPFRLRPDAVEAALKDEDERGRARSGGDGTGDGASARVRRLNVPFAPDGVGSSRLLAPPICSGGHGDSSSHTLPTRLLGGLGGSYDSLTSMRSLLSLPQSTAPASEPLQPSLSQYATNILSPRGEAPLNAFGNRRLGSGTSLCALDSDSNASRGGGGRSSGGCWGRYNGTGGGVGLGSHLFAVYAEFRLLFSGGHWDCSFRVTAMDTGRLIVSIARHRGVVMSLSLTDGGHGCCRLVTSSRDTTLMVWKVDPGSEPPVSSSSLLHVLYGHDTPITCVCASAALDAIVSSGEDGTLVVHTVWRGEYLRTITPRGHASPVAVPDSAPGRPRHSAESTGGDGNEEFDEIDDGRGSSSSYAGTKGAKSEAPSSTNSGRKRLPPPWASVEWVGLSAAGYVVAYSPADATLRSYTVNGHALGVAKVASEAGPLRAFVFSEDGSVLLSGGCDRAVTLRWAHSLAMADDDAREGCGGAVLNGSTPSLAGVPGAAGAVKKFGSAVRCLTLTAGEQHLLVGLEDGTLGVLALDARYLRQRLRSKLDQLGI